MSNSGNNKQIKIHIKHVTQYVKDKWYGAEGQRGGHCIQKSFLLYENVVRILWLTYKVKMLTPFEAKSWRTIKCHQTKDKKDSKFCALV